MATVVRMRCTKISTQKHWSKNEDGSSNIQSEIQLAVAYCNDPKDPNYPYAQLSGGTVFPLNTINQEAAKDFELDGEYEVVITRVK